MWDLLEQPAARRGLCLVRPVLRSPREACGRSWRFRHASQGVALPESDTEFFAGNRRATGFAGNPEQGREMDGRPIVNRRSEQFARARRSYPERETSGVFAPLQRRWLPGRGRYISQPYSRDTAPTPGAAAMRVVLLHTHAVS